MKIADFEIGQGKTFVIAELSANHNGSYQTAVKTIEAAAKAGADAIKLQTYRADTITLDSDKEYFKINHGTLWDGRTLYDLYKEAYTPWDWQPKLKKVAEKNGLICFSSPFDHAAVDFLENMNVPAYKIASFEITDIPLIEYVASKGKPIIISTGIARLDDIELAVNTCKKAGNNQIVLLKCTSSYPAQIADANLLTISDMEKRFAVIAGLSDHTEGADVAIAAVALGTSVIEKHIILDRSIGGPDAEFSMEMKDFTKMVTSIRNIEKAIGQVSYDLTDVVEESRKFRRSLFVVKDMKKGDVFTKENIRSIRPGHGMHPKDYNKILGKQIITNVNKGTPLTLELMGE
jgi:pseudaminic acid synthase